MALADFRAMQERCSNCSYCKWIPFDHVKSARFAENCPSECMYNFNTYSARGRFQAGLAVNNQELDYDETFRDVVFSCLDCGSCDVSCKICRYNLEPLEHNRELKHDAVEKGCILPRHRELLDSFRAEQTLMAGEKRSDRTKWARDIPWAEEPEALFFPGCRYSYDETMRRSVQTAAGLLLDAGVKLGYLGQADMCCGGRLYQMGSFEPFEEQARANLKAIEGSGAQVIVTPCSDCYYAFKRLYPRLGLQMKVLHVVEYLDQLIAEGRLKFTKALDLTVTYHDPCHLGRQGEPYVPWDGTEQKIFNQVHTWNPKRPRYNGAHGIYDAPRRVIQAIPGVTLVEMERIREYSWCCGAGGGCSELNPELSSATAAERVVEARATSADELITACPWCRQNFEAAGEIPVEDILDLARRAL